jgi:hypothetical protein
MFIHLCPLYYIYRWYACFIYRTRIKQIFSVNKLTILDKYELITFKTVQNNGIKYYKDNSEIKMLLSYEKKSTIDH